MLDTLREGVQSWVAKFILDVLVASSRVWGISGSIMSVGRTAALQRSS